MLLFRSYDIVFREVPGEITLAINLAACPNRCKGCHSPWLQEDRGEVLSKEVLFDLFLTYREGITCVCFMGGDAAPKEVEQLATFIRRATNGKVKTAWYSGRAHLPANCNVEHFDFIKLGPYIEVFGGLDSPTTNQRFYRVENGKMIDMTEAFRVRELIHI